MKREGNKNQIPEQMLKAELLSPAGSLKTLQAVAVAGADAVYCAGNKFGARAYAENFTETELLYAIDYLHLHGKKLYLTVNTLLKERELQKELYEYLYPLYRQGLDGVILQDFGVLAFLREYFPGMELHASTQMNITGPHAAQCMKDLGCSRIVTARELSLAEIKEIHDKVDIEIESFIHGALCYCYSGQCLLSSMLGGRSGNRGRCAQPCRLPYKTKKSGEGYFLSPKDLCTIELLPEILESGVYSLKIEGRMKQAEYAAGVTSIYREYLNRCLVHPQEEYRVSPEDFKRLEALGSRSGFTKGYYQKQNGPDMMAMEKPAHSKSKDGLQEEMQRRFLKKELQEKINGILILSKEIPASLVLQCKGKEISVKGDVVQQAKNRPMESAIIEEKMRKTGGSGFVFDKLDIQMEDDVFIPVGALNQLRRTAMEALQEKLLEDYRRADRAYTDSSKEAEESGFEKKRSDSSRRLKPQEGAYEQPYLAVAVSNEIQLRQVLNYSFVNRIYLDSSMLLREQLCVELKALTNQVHYEKKELWLVMPAVLRKDALHWYESNIKKLAAVGIDGFVVGNYEGFQLLTENLKNEKNSEICCGGNQSPSCQILTDSSLYAWSQESAELLRTLGAADVTLPVEANEQELLSRGYRGGELLIYGYLPLMVSAQCVVKNTEGCKKKTGFLSMKDRYGKVFMVKNQCQDCYNIIYNTSPLSLLHQYSAVEKLKPSGYRISFTREKEDQVKRVMSYYEQGFLKKKRLDMKDYFTDFTNGHFKRGVE